MRSTDERATQPDETHGRRVLNAFIAGVAALAIVLAGLVVWLERSAAPTAVNWAYVSLFIALLLLSETRTGLLRFGDGGEVTPSWAFAYCIVLLGSPVAAIAAMAGCVVFVDLRDRMGVQKTIFNVSQITVSLSVGALILRAFRMDGPVVGVESLTPRIAIGVMLAAAALFAVNVLLTCIVLALHYRTSLRSMIGRDFMRSVSADGALLAVSPIFVVAIQYSLLLLPLLGVTAFLVYQSAQQALQRAHEASHDPLTRLLNRRAFTNHLEGFLAAHDDDAKQGLVMMMDLDGFKEINDRLGHQTGDTLLRSVAERIAAVVPNGSLVGRLGGDEFVVLVPELGTDVETHSMVESMRRGLTQPFEIDGFPLSVGMSIGLALMPAHGRSSEDLLSAADIAMYRAKRYRTGVEFYKAAAARAERGRLGLLSELTDAIREGQLDVYFQPLTRFEDGSLDSVEALVRWRHPLLGALLPGEFVTLAEHTDLIGPLTNYVLDHAVREIAPLPGIKLSVNVSARNMQDRRFPATVLKTLTEAGMDPHRLELEITESTLTREPERSTYTIETLRERGVRIAIDDFGSGYSSFAMLRDCTVDRLKIDAGFVRGIAASKRQQDLVQAIVALAGGLGLETVAEGVEDHETWSTLKQLGCEIAQGYLVSTPLPTDQLHGWLEQRQMVAMEAS